MLIIWHFKVEDDLDLDDLDLYDHPSKHENWPFLSIFVTSMS